MTCGVVTVLFGFVSKIVANNVGRCEALILTSGEILLIRNDAAQT